MPTAISVYRRRNGNDPHSRSEYQNKIEVIHEGVDVDVVKPDPDAVLRLPSGRELRRSDEVVTFVARNLEPLRGYHSFMRALPRIMTARPKRTDCGNRRRRRLLWCFGAQRDDVEVYVLRRSRGAHRPRANTFRRTFALFGLSECLANFFGAYLPHLPLRVVLVAA